MALVAWYPLNGTLENNGNSDFDLTSSNNLNYDVGKIGKAINFNGNYLRANASPFKNTTKYSICGWIYLDTITNVTHTIICSRIGMGFGLSLFIMSNKMRIDASIDNTSLQWTTDYVFEAKKWTHFAVTNNNGNISYYINGELQQTKKITSTVQRIGDYITIGASSESNTIIGNSNYFKGRINDLRIYDNVLSEFEIQEVYRTLILKYSFDTPVIDPKVSTIRTTDISSLLDGGTNKCAIIGSITYNKEYFIENNYVTISFDLDIKDIKPIEGNRGILTIQSRTVINGTEKWGTFINTTNELYGRSGQLRIYRRNNKLYKLIEKWTISYRKML